MGDPPSLCRCYLTTCPRHPTNFVTHRERSLPGGACNSIELGQDDGRGDRLRTICVRDRVIELGELGGSQLDLGFLRIIHRNRDDGAIRKRDVVGYDDAPTDMG